eukprot:5565989-Pyramimonas_sp.AAC.1
MATRASQEAEQGEPGGREGQRYRWHTDLTPQLTPADSAARHSGDEGAYARPHAGSLRANVDDDDPAV